MFAESFAGCPNQTLEQIRLPLCSGFQKKVEADTQIEGKCHRRSREDFSIFHTLFWCTTDLRENCLYTKSPSSHLLHNSPVQNLGLSL